MPRAQIGWSESAWAALAGCQLAQVTAADAVAAVKSALLDGYLDGARQLTTADVLRRVRSIRPTSEVKREDIADLRRWAQEHLAIDAVRGEAASGERLLEF